MQTHGGAAAEAAILGAERVFRAKVRVDWNRNGQFDHPLSNLDRYIDSVDVERSLKGSAPEDILLIEGSASAELTLVLHGDFQGAPLVSVFSPFNSTGPLAGIQKIDAEITYSILLDTPLGTFEYPQFIGNIRTAAPDRQEASVVIIALDRAEKLRKPIRQAPFAVSEQQVAYGELDSQFIYSHWVIDNALRLCDSGVSDKRPSTRQELGLASDSLDGVLVWVTGNGSYIPTIGYLDNLGASTFPNPGDRMFEDNGPEHPAVESEADSPQGLAGLGLPLLSDAPSISPPGHKGVLRYWVADQHRLNAQAVHYLGCTLNLIGTSQNVSSIGKHNILEIILGGGNYLHVVVENGYVWMERFHNWGVSTGVTSAVPIPTSGSHVDLFLMWDMTPGNSRVYIRAGTNTNNGGNWQTVGSPVVMEDIPNVDQIKGRLTIGQALSMSDVFYGTSNKSGKPPNDTSHVWRLPAYPAVLDRGLNRFSFIPSAKREEAWELVKNVAAAEFGSVFWDENGIFRFWNWQTMLDKRNTIVRTFSLDHVEGLRVSNNLDSVRNVYSVKTTKKRSSTGTVNVFKSNDVMEFFTPARTTNFFTIWLDNVVSPLTFFMPRYASHTNSHGLPVWDNNTGDPKYGFVVQYYLNGEWTEDDTLQSPRVAAYFTADGYITLRVENYTSYDIRLAQGWPGGNIPDGPRLNIAGTAIFDPMDLVLEYRNDESIDKYGERTLELSGDWYQDSTWSTRMLDVVSARTADPVPTTDAITVAGDPRLQLGDVVQILDANDGLGIMDLQIFGIRREFSREGGLTDRLSVEMVPPPGPPPDVDPGDPSGQTVVRHNTCTNPACFRDAADWWGGSRVTGLTGTSRSTGYQVSSGSPAIAPKTEVRPGDTYVFSADVKGVGGSTSFNAYIDWYSNSGYMSSSPGTSSSVTSGGVKRVYTSAQAAPLGATKALLVVSGHTTTVAVTAVLYEKTTQQGTYFDGDSPGANWDGAQGSSSSRITEEI